MGMRIFLTKMKYSTLPNDKFLPTALSEMKPNADRLVADRCDNPHINN